MGVCAWLSWVRHLVHIVSQDCNQDVGWDFSLIGSSAGEGPSPKMTQVAGGIPFLTVGCKTESLSLLLDIGQSSPSVP